MIFYLFFLLLIVKAKQIEECFELNEETVEFNNDKTTMKIIGTGFMCHCHNDKLSNYKETVQSIQIDNSVKSIGKQCLMNYNKLTEISLGSGITQIEKYAIYNTKIKEITIPGNVQLIEEFAFAENKELKTITFNENEEEIRIENYAFKNCEKLTSFHLPKRLKQFNPLIFDECNFQSITVDKNHENYEVNDNSLFDINGTKLIYYQKGLENEKYLVSEETEIIEEKAFINNKLNYILFPITLKNIQ